MRVPPGASATSGLPDSAPSNRSPLGSSLLVPGPPRVPETRRRVATSGGLLIVARQDGPVYYGKWRDSTGRQVKKRLGPAWLEPDGAGGWRKRRGRVPSDHLDARRAMVLLGRTIETREEDLATGKLDHPVEPATFAEAAEAWLHHLEHVKGVKPSTLLDHRYYLAPADTAPRKRGKPPAARIMKKFGHRPLASIGKVEIAHFLNRLDADPAITPRTVNKYRQILHSVFEYAMREETFALPINPVRGIDKRREPDPTPIDFYEAEEVCALARAAELGAHRNPSRPAVTQAEIDERRRADLQDAALFLVAAFTGLRMGELLALRWRNVDFTGAKLVVEASWSAGRLTSPKSGKWRAVPLADQPAAALDGLSQRKHFTGRDDLVFCNAVGEYLDPSALRRRYKRAQQAAGLRELRFHDLRHSFGSLIIREFDPVSVKSFMGHAKLTTTERYLHARPRRTDALRLTKTFAGPDAPELQDRPSPSDICH